MNSQASLAQLHASPATKSEFIAPIELSYRGSGRRWLVYWSVMLFVLGFASQQLSLRQAAGAGSGLMPVAVIEAPAESAVASEQPVNSDVSMAPAATIVVTDQETPSPAITNELPVELLAAAPVDTDATQAVDDRQVLKQMQLALLQRNAVMALERDRLLTPQHDNAVYYYQSMLALDEQNPAAQDGLQAVAARYVEFARRLRARGDTAGARIMLANADQVWPGSGSSFAVQSQSEVNNSAQATAIRQTPVAVVPEVQPSASTRRARLLRQVSSFSQSGQHQAIVALLEPETESLRQDGRLLTALHAAYIAMGQQDKARQLSARADLNEVDANMLRAQEWLSQQNYAEAIAQLELAPPAAADNPEYFTLLAGLYYQTGRHLDSQTLYRELLKQDDTNGRWWLGYAVSSDALNHTDTLVAYRGALKYLAQSDTARSYAEQRLEQLSVNQGGVN